MEWKVGLWKLGDVRCRSAASGRHRSGDRSGGTLCGLLSRSSPPRFDRACGRQGSSRSTRSVEGPVAKIIAVIIVTSLSLAFGTSGRFRPLIQIVFGLSIAFAALSFRSSRSAAGCRSNKLLADFLPWAALVDE